MGCHGNHVGVTSAAIGVTQPRNKGAFGSNGNVRVQRYNITADKLSDRKVLVSIAMGMQEEVPVASMDTAIPHRIIQSEQHIDSIPRNWIRIFFQTTSKYSLDLIF